MSRWCVFISGRGSNMQALIDNLATTDLRLIVSSSATAPGLLRARRHGLPSMVLPLKIDWVALDKELRQRGIDRIFLAGFMKMIPAAFVEKWKHRILNVHPSLLPAFPGLHAIDKSFAAGNDMGVTVHVVTPEMDAGPRLLQRRSLSRAMRGSCSAEEAQYRISRDEQHLVREGMLKWK